jgi:hypothetical protein
MYAETVIKIYSMAIHNKNNYKKRHFMAIQNKHTYKKLLIYIELNK